ncbi:MAG TPA: stalk domain-containing protein [Bacillota bacterium]|nr:stalk domain-containing protein [Bacillota bacterium]
MMHWKKATFGVLAASLIFSQAAFADQATTTSTTTNTNTTATTGATTGTSTNTTTSATNSTPTTTTSSTDPSTTVSTDTNTSTTTSGTEDQSSVNSKDVNKLTKKLDKIESKLQQFQNQDVPAEAQLGKIDSIQNRLAALTGQMDKIAELQKQLDQLDGDQASQAADALTVLYDQAGDLESAIKVEKEFVQKKLKKEAKDEEILKDYKELGKLLRKSGKVGVQALVNGQEPNMDVPPVIENGRTLLPFRALAESLGAQVSYDPATRTVTVTKGDTKVVLTLDSVSATVNDQPYTLDVPAKVVQGRTLIPLRFLGQSLHAKVLWEQETQMAIVIGDQNNSQTGTTATGTSAGSTTTGTTEVVGTTPATTDSTTSTPSTSTNTTGSTNTTTSNEVGTISGTVGDTNTSAPATTTSTTTNTTTDTTSNQPTSTTTAQ